MALITIIPTLYLANDSYIDNKYKSKVNYFISNAIETKYHVIHSSFDQHKNLIKIDVIIDNYKEHLNDSINATLKKYD